MSAHINMPGAFDWVLILFAAARWLEYLSCFVAGKLNERQAESDIRQ